jgi:hypothetical protein
LVRAYAVAAIVIALLLVPVAWVAVVLVGPCLVSVENRGARTVDLTVSSANAAIGTARLAPGERMLRVFVPRMDGDVDVACREAGSKKTIASRNGYVTGGWPVRYVVTVHGCADVRVRQDDIGL